MNNKINENEILKCLRTMKRTRICGWVYETFFFSQSDYEKKTLNLFLTLSETIIYESQYFTITASIWTCCILQLRNTAFSLGSERERDNLHKDL